MKKYQKGVRFIENDCFRGTIGGTTRNLDCGDTVCMETLDSAGNWTFSTEKQSDKIDEIAARFFNVAPHGLTKDVKPHQYWAKKAKHYFLSNQYKKSFYGSFAVRLKMRKEKGQYDKGCL